MPFLYRKMGKVTAGDVRCIPERDVFMIIETKELGFVEISEEDMITFPQGLYGFEDAVRFALLKDRSKPENPFMWLQCVDKKEPCFVVADPKRFFSDYSPVLSGEEIRRISSPKAENLRFLVIASVPKNVRKTSLNLKCPLALNISQRTAMQVILENTDYPMRCYLFEEAEE